MSKEIPKQSAIHFHLSEKDKDAFTSICMYKGMSKTEVLRRYVSDVVRKGEF